MFQQFHLPLAAIRQPAFLYGSDGRITVANDLAEALAGRPLSGCTAADIIAIFGNRHPDGRKFTPEELPPSRALAGEEALDVPITVTAADGRTVHILATASLIREGDEIAGALVVWQDVSALEAALAEQSRLHLDAEGRADELASVSSERGRHRQLLDTEAALRESEERLRLAQESAKIAVWDWDVRTGLYTSTPEFFRLYGLEEDRTITYDQWRERVHPDDIGRLESERDAALVRGEPFDTEFRIVRASGETHWLQAIGRGIVDESGTLVRVLGVNIDITARKAAEEVLAATVEQYRQALNNPLLGYALCEIVTDGAGRPQDFVYLDVNPAFEAFTGLARDRVLNRRVTEILVPAEVAQLIQVYGHVALTGEPRTFQYSIPSLGRSYEVAAFSPQHGRFIAFFTDVTARKEAERELEQNAASLRRSNEELLRFAYVASHDLQEPLRPIVSFSQLLERRYKGKLDADADDYINFIVEGGNRMQSLIRDLLQFSRLETRALPLAPTDAAEAVADALRLLDTPLREANGTVDVGDLPTVLADRRQLEQVFVNLIGNAVKYRQPDMPSEIRVSAQRAGPMVAFTVADNGIGIEEEYYDRVFEMFRRLHTNDKYSGTGIGLAVVKKIVERHGGTVRVESTPGEGSTFFFTLPAA